MNQPKRQFSRRKTFFFSLILILLGLLIVLTIAELIARALEDYSVSGGDHAFMPHAELGWIAPAGNDVTQITDEFEAHYSINALGMNDEPLGADESSRALRIMALGDSHTFAAGVSMPDTWPNALEAQLFNGRAEQGAVYNLGVIGYSLGQYLQRMRSLREELDPHIALIGFSMATDVYDLIPPSRGGFIYGGEYGRAYYDLDDNGELVERRELVGLEISQEDQQDSQLFANKLRLVLGKFALYRRLKRSQLAVWIATHVQLGDQSLWPGMDTALKIHLNEDDRFRWQLAEKILHEIAREAKSNNIEPVLVNIPYLAQVYDDIWGSSFGSLPDKYQRWIGGERLQAICERAGIHYIDTTRAFVETARDTGRWLHFRKDGHPTVEGHALIASTVKAGLLRDGLIQEQPSGVISLKP